MSYFVDGEFCLLAHRGLSQHRDDLDENTIDAFAEALDHGATHLESDIQCSKDGVAVLFHDDDLRRVAGVEKTIAELDYQQIKEIALRAGGSIPSLEEALEVFPNTRFNLDLKTAAAISPAADVISEKNAYGRVLLSSFSFSTRKRILAETEYKTVSSADARTFLRMFTSHLLSSPLLLGIAKDFHALQIPTRRSFLRFDSPRFAKKVRDLGLQLHYWTINDPSEMLRLSEYATGIVTDRVDLAPNSLRNI